MKAPYWLLSGVLLSVMACSERELRETDIQELPMDSSFAVIAQTASVLADSCIPVCWPRVFADMPESTLYTAYVLASTQQETGRFTKEKRSRFMVDSLSYPMLLHLAALPVRRLTATAINVKHSDRLQLRLIDKPFDELLSRPTDVGYLRVSPVVIDAKRRTGVYTISLLSTGYSRLLIQVRYTAGKWQVVRKDLLAIS